MKNSVRSILKRIPFLRRKMKGHLGEVVEGAAAAFLLRALGAALAFGFNWLVARRYGAGGAGIFFLALTVLAFATVLGKMGLDNSLLRFIAANAAVRRWKAVKGVYARGMALALLVSGAISLLLFLAAPLIAAWPFRKPELASPLQWIALAVVPLTFLALQAESLKGLKKIKEAVLTNAVLLPLFSSLGLLLVGNRSGVAGASCAYLVSATLTGAVGFWFWRSATASVGWVKGEFGSEELLKSNLPLFWTSLLDTTTNWSSVFFLGIWATKEQVGVFGAALRTAMAVSLILTSVNSIAAPKFAELYKKKKMKELDETARQGARLMIFLAGPVLILFIVFPGFFMGLFGQGFRVGAPLLSILALGEFVNVATGSVGYLLVMSGNEKLMRNRAVFMAGTALVLNFLLIPRFGALGAAISTSFCVALTNLIAVNLVHQKLGIWMLPLIRCPKDGAR